MKKSTPSIERNDLLAGALALAARGLPVLPVWWVNGQRRCACGNRDCDHPGKHPLSRAVPHGVKNATRDPAVIKDWWGRWPEANVGVATGRKSGIVVLDVDPRNGGLESFAKLEAKHGKLVETYRVQTPGTKKHGPGRHYYFSYSKKLLEDLKKCTEGLDGLDIIGNGYVLAPGSNHVSGGEYKIVSHPLAAFESKAFLPTLVQAPKPASPVTRRPDEPDTVDAEFALAREAKELRATTKNRNDHLNDVACWNMGPFIRDGDISQKQVEDELYRAARACGLGEQESKATIQTGLKAAIKKNHPPPEAEGLSDDDLALMFSDKHKDGFRYVDDWHRWMAWTETHWAKDRVLDVFSQARQLCREVALGEKKSVVNRIKSAKSYAAIERAARNDKRQASISDDWNCHPWLLNTPGGTAEQECTAGQGITLRAHRREDYITKITPAAPGGPCPRWMQFLDEITTPPGGSPDKELQAYVQRHAGYCSTGSIREQKLFFLYGSGGNGKGTWLRALVAALGSDYAKSVQPETFLESGYERHPCDVASLQGARLIIVPDMPTGRRWNMERIKAFSGGDSIQARFMRTDFFNFDPEFKLILGGNDKPSLRSVNDAIRRRFVMIPFLGKFLGAKDDKKLDDKLRAEAGGILQWILDGCAQWQAIGLRPPKFVTGATEEYIAGEDILAQFLELKCVREIDARVSKSKLFAVWASFCQATGEEIGNRKLFAQNMENVGFSSMKVVGERFYRGLRLRGPNEPLEEQPPLPGAYDEI